MSDNMNQVNETAQALLSAMHAHVQAIAQKPIDPTMLLELERTCQLARRLIAVGRDPSAFGKNQLTVPPGSVIGMGGGWGDNPGYDAPMLPTANPTETFGVQAIKELVALIPDLFNKQQAAVVDPPPPALNYAELASAMAQARGAGDEALYAKLMDRLEADQKRAELVNKKLEREKADAPKALPAVATESEAA